MDFALKTRDFVSKTRNCALKTMNCAQLHVLAIYLVLGIGADDLFVFYDAWLQSNHEPPHISGSDLTRMNYAYQRAAGAMLTTSFTTSVFIQICIKIKILQ